MTALFLDTFYWIALADPTDSAHKRALALTAERADSRIVTTDEVLTEYLTFFASAPEPTRYDPAEIVEDLPTNSFDSGNTAKPGILPRRLQLYRVRPDKRYSLTDCISMETMRREGLIEVLTNDRHFEQEGFRALFR